MLCKLAGQGVALFRLDLGNGNEGHPTECFQPQPAIDEFLPGLAGQVGL